MNGRWYKYKWVGSIFPLFFRRYNTFALLLTIGMGCELSGMSSVDGITGWHGNADSSEHTDMNGRRIVEFKLKREKNKAKYRAIAYLTLKNPPQGKYCFSFLFRREEYNMQLIPSCRVFTADGKDYFEYSKLTSAEYPEEGGWIAVNRIFQIPPEVIKVNFVLEARNHTDSLFWIGNPVITYVKE